MIFVDGSYLEGSIREECSSNVKETINLLTSLGFIIRTTKSVLEPVQGNFNEELRQFNREGTSVVVASCS